MPQKLESAFRDVLFAIQQVILLPNALHRKVSFHGDEGELQSSKLNTPWAAITERFVFSELLEGERSKL